jgi:hypothetical protein
MKMSRNILALATAVAGCVVVVWLSASIQGSPKTYEVQPHITIPEYKTDAARTIDAYERLMDRYMNLTERNLFRVDTDIQDIVKKLDSIDNKLTKLSTRISGIEKALGIEQTDTAIKEEPQPESVDKKPSSSTEG